MSKDNTNSSQHTELMNVKDALNKVKKEDKNYMAHGFDNNDGDAVYQRMKLFEREQEELKKKKKIAAMGGKKIFSQTDVDSDAENKPKTNDPAVMKDALKKTKNPVVKGTGRSDPSNMTKKTKVNPLSAGRRVPVSNDAPERKVITDVISQDIDNVDPEIGMALASLEPMRKPTGPRVKNGMAQVDSDAEPVNDVAAAKAALKKTKTTVKGTP